MILVSLLDLVQVPDTEHLWPEEFRQLVQSYEEARKPKPRPTDEADGNGTRTMQEVEDRSMFPAIADWLIAHGEDEYAEAWKWLANHRDVAIQTQLEWKTSRRYYTFDHNAMPASLRSVGQAYSGACLIANLAIMIQAVKRDLWVE